MNVQTFHKSIVAIRSVSHEEKALADFLETFFHDQDILVHRKKNNVWAQIGSGEGPGLLLCSHIDTVAPTATWTRDPWEPTEHEGRRYGLGSNDAKASVAAMTFAFLAARSHMKAWGGTVLLALVANEETGREGLETIVDDLKPLNAAIVGEPNGMNICTSQKGICVFDLTWQGVSAHAAHGSSDHAIKKALPELQAISHMTFDRIDPNLGATKIEITKLHAGEKTNVIPDLFQATVDIRQTPQYTPEELKALVQAKAPNATLSVFSDRRQAVYTSESETLVQAAKQVQKGRSCVASQTASDWTFLKHVPAIKMGPGDTRVSHTPDEYVETRLIDEAVEIYTQTLATYFKEMKTCPA